MKIPTASHELKELCASCLREECEGRDRYHMNASICSRHEPVTLEHVKALMVAMDRLREEAQQAAVAVAWAYQTEEEEYQRFQKLLASLEEDCEPSAGYVSEMLEHITTLRSRLRSSPAPVVGGVPELTPDDVRCAVTGSYLWTTTANKLNKLIASRLPALKPGEVEAIEKIIAASRVCANEGGTDLRCCVQTDHHHIALLALDKIRAQPTPTEKETDHDH